MDYLDMYIQLLFICFVLTIYCTSRYYYKLLSKWLRGPPTCQNNNHIRYQSYNQVMNFNICENNIMIQINKVGINMLNIIVEREYVNMKKRDNIISIGFLNVYCFLFKIDI